MSTQEDRTCAIVLSAGSGSRMGTAEKKQYLALHEKPLIAYALQALEESFIDDVILVTSAEDAERCRKEIVERFSFTKVRRIVEGGRERYHSVAAGLNSIPDSRYVFIHDGARPFLTGSMLTDLYRVVRETGAAVAAMPVKNTIKTADSNGYVLQTPARSTLWEIQTPQVFETHLIRECYEKLLRDENALKESFAAPTDDAELVERYTDVKVKLVRTSYTNLKITTPEDLISAEALITSLSVKPPLPLAER